MAKLNRRSISRRTVAALKVDKDTVFWDRDLPGFGVRVYASGTKNYVVQSRAKGKSVRMTVGRHGVISADEARRRAARIVNRIKAGEEPVAEPLPARLAGGPTVADLAARYMEEHVAVHCRASTAEGIQGLLDKYIVPEFGRLPLPAVERERVVAFHARLSGVPYAANRAVAVLSRMYRMATSRGMVPDGTNPCRGVRKFPTRLRERFLTDTEFRRLGTVLDRAVADGGVSVHAVAAIRLLLLTGCRKSEILSLRWEDVDMAAGEIRLADSKTGPRAVPLSPPAVRVLAELPRVADSPWVIPGQKPGTHLTNLDGPWWIVRKRAGLEEVRIHDCRHSFASRALALGESLPVIAKLLGHSQIQTTARYAHLARDSVKASAARVADSIAGDFLYGGSSALERSSERQRRWSRSDSGEMSLRESLPVIGKLLGHTVDQVKERNAEYDQHDMLDLVDEEVSAARARCS